MKIALRILSGILLIALLTTGLLSCKSQWEKEGEKVIGSCAGYDVLYEELRYVTLSYKDMFASTYGEDIWATAESAERYRAELEETVWDMMLNNYAVLAACAYHGLGKDDLESDAITAAVDGQIDEMIEYYGSKKTFRAAVEEMYMTEHFTRFCLSVAELENELCYVLQDLGKVHKDQGKFLEWLEEGNYAYVQHIFLRNDPGDDPATNRAKAEEVAEKLRNGANIADFIGNSKYNEDTANLSPYYLVRDVYDPAIEKAALALRFDGDVSSVVETENGYYVLVRMESSTDKLMLQLPTLLTSYQWAKTEAVVEEFRAKITLELNEYGKSIDLLTIQ
ncbi:MAG: peptidylprolyl isomerase [Clostridia bacterium]|nr:peptidylprolyl isomerase [Clostridia bacterium]